MKKEIYDPKEAKKIGMLTPSSNTVLEPICSSMVHGLEDKVTMHYSRLAVKTISLDEDGLAQFDIDPFLRASELLAHADVDVIAWNGTSGGWFGLESDRMICHRITKETGIPATTSMLAMIDAFKKNNVETVHTITPYVSEINNLIKKQYKKLGYEVINFRGLEQTINRSFSLVNNEEIYKMCREVSVDKADAISILCTNLKAAYEIEQIEKDFSTTVYDSIAITVWKTLQMVGIDPSIVEGWGRIFKSEVAKVAI